MEKTDNIIGFEPQPAVSRREKLERGESMPFLGKLLGNLPEVFKDVEFRPVQTLRELRMASHLVYRDYRKLGYIPESKSELKISIFNALPTTTTYVALHKKNHVLATLTLVEDTPVGLPMDEVYKSELDVLRRRDKHLIEATMFALDADQVSEHGVLPLNRSERLQLILHLFKNGFDYLRGATYSNILVGCFHPRHDVLYKFIQMEPLGGLKEYKSVNGAPAISRFVAFREKPAIVPDRPVIQFLMAGPLPHPANYFHRLDFSVKELLELFVQETDVFKRASPEQMAYVHKCYPGLITDKTPWILSWLKRAA